jgi:hypothetical protein
MDLGASLIGGALGDLLLGDVINDVSYDRGFDDGGDFGGDMSCIHKLWTEDRNARENSP